MVASRVVSPEIEDKIKRQFTYDPDTGIVTRTTHMGTSNGFVDNNGYLKFRFYYGRGKSFDIKAHRIAWFLYHKCWPVQIDHINRDKTDNRICNIRDVNSAVNNFNRDTNPNNTSGHTGVYWLKCSKKWLASISSRYNNGKTIFLCSSRDKEECIYVSERVREYILDAELNGRELTKEGIQSYAKSVRRDNE